VAQERIRIKDYAACTPEKTMDAHSPSALSLRESNYLRFAKLRSQSYVNNADRADAVDALGVMRSR
jgi:hypothetical protein